jgi:hypothetical protein
LMKDIQALQLEASIAIIQKTVSKKNFLMILPLV